MNGTSAEVWVGPFTQLLVKLLLDSARISNYMIPSCKNREFTNSYRLWPVWEPSGNGKQAV